MMRRYLTAAALTVAVVPAVVGLPVVTAPTPQPRPVPPRVDSLGVAGVDGRAARRLEAQGRLRERPVGGVVPPGPAVLSAERATSRFDLVGVTWDGDEAADTRVAVRVREDGAWSGWEPLEVADGGPDADTAEGRTAAKRAGTEPMITGGDADGVQVRVDTADGRAPSGLRVVLVDPGRSAADRAMQPAAPASSAQAATGRPSIITRRQWGADERLRNCEPGTTTGVKALFLHHTAGSNHYTRAQAASILRSTYAYHTNGRKWCDIGYNFLVDRYGRIYEGRAGSIDAAVIGAHSGGFNAQSLGVAAMGNFDSAGPPAAVLSGVKKVLAWKAARYFIDPRGSVRMTSSGGGTSRYPAGRTVRLRTISGHRDVGLTACPGRYLYPGLGSVRSAIASRMRPGLSSAATAPTVADVGAGRITVTAAVPTRQRWSLTVTPICSSRPVRTITGTAASGISAGWDLTDTAGAPVGPGLYTLLLTTRSPVGAGPSYRRDVEVIDPTGIRVNPCLVQRLAGAGSAGTSVAVGHAAQPGATSVVVTSQDSPSSALVAAPYARHTGAPLLLTPPGQLSTSVASDIAARSVTSAVVIGAASTVSATVVSQLQALGVGVRRIAGADRFATAAAVAQEMATPDRRAFVVSGDAADLVYGMSAAGAAARTGRPVLFSDRGTLPSATRSALGGLGVTGVDVVGSTYAVPQSVRTALSGIGISSVRRGHGDRYATAAAVASAYAGSSPQVVVVSGWSRSGLATSIQAGQLGQVMLLTRPGAVPATTGSWLGAANPAKVSVVGRPDAVSTGTLHALYTAAR